MLHHSRARSLPRIVVSEAEEHSLTDLATAAELTGRSQQVARALLAEMDAPRSCPMVRFRATWCA